MEGVTAVEPTLTQLTQAALADLSRDADGFFLMVEGGAIDWAAHSRDPGGVAAEVREYDRAVKAAYDWAKTRGDTLLVITSDHETGGLQVDARTDYAADPQADGDHRVHVGPHRRRQDDHPPDAGQVRRHHAHGGRGGAGGEER